MPGDMLTNGKADGSASPTSRARSKAGIASPSPTYPPHNPHSRIDINNSQTANRVINRRAKRDRAVYRNRRAGYTLEHGSDVAYRSTSPSSDGHNYPNHRSPTPKGPYQHQLPLTSTANGIILSSPPKTDPRERGCFVRPYWLVGYLPSRLL